MLALLLLACSTSPEPPDAPVVASDIEAPSEDDRPDETPSGLPGALPDPAPELLVAEPGTDALWYYDVQTGRMVRLED